MLLTTRVPKGILGLDFVDLMALYGSGSEIQGFGFGFREKAVGSRLRVLGFQAQNLGLLGQRV